MRKDFKNGDGCVCQFPVSYVMESQQKIFDQAFSVDLTMLMDEWLLRTIQMPLCFLKKELKLAIFYFF